MLLLLLAACDTTPEPVETEVEGCVPFESAYTANAAPIIESKCGSCHGSTPEFGAPYSLVEGYADLLSGEIGERKVDALLASLLDGSMPQGDADPLSHNELDTLVGWASCGLEHPPEDDELFANRDIWEAPDSPPEGSVAVDLIAVDEPVGLDAIDDYRTFRFNSVVEESGYIHRIEPVIDESRVLHHITLTKRGGFPYLYAWAPGTGAIQFPDGGMAIEPGDAFEVEIHYNNGAGIPDAVDSSGVRMWVGQSAEIVYGMASPNLWNMVIPAGEGKAFSTTCTATQDFEILAGMPHMHEIGSTFKHDLIRGDGSVENLIELSGWSFESQYFYEMPVQVQAGDKLEMTCGYFNDTEETVTAGLATGDEMCFDFLVVTPASAESQCQ